jgi:hypothetical protein
MIDRILESSLCQRAFVLFGAAALLAAGLWSAFHLPIDAVPDITGVQVQVNTEVPALAAEESEKLVTQPRFKPNCPTAWRSRFNTTARNSLTAPYARSKRIYLRVLCLLLRQ